VGTIQIVGEAALRIGAITNELQRTVQRSVNDALKGVKAPKSNALTDLQRDLRRGELDLAKAREIALDAQEKISAAEKTLTDLRRSGTASAEDLTAAEKAHRRALLDVAIASEKVTSAEERGVRTRQRIHQINLEIAEEHARANERQATRLEQAFGRMGASIERNYARLRTSVSSRMGSVFGSLASGSRSAVANGVKLALVGTAAAGAVSSVASLTGAVGSLVAGLGQAAGVAGLLPAALVAVKAVTATVTLALTGMDDALKAVASGDAAKLEEALGKLSPAAAGFVRELDAAKPAFDRMRLDVQERAFAGLADSVQGLAERYLPVANQLFGGLADTMNGMVSDLINFAMSGEALGKTNITVENIRKAFSNLRLAVAPLGRALLDVVSVGSTFLPRLTDALSQAVSRWSERISAMAASGELEAFFQRALEALAQLGRIAGNVGSLIAGVFRAADAGGGGLLNTLEQITEEMSAFVNSAQGQGALRSFFGAMRQVVQALLPVIKSAVVLVGQLAPVFGRLAEIVGPILSSAFDILGPHLVTLGNLFADLVEATAPLIDALVELVAEALSAIEPVLPDIVAAFSDFVQVLADMLRGDLGAILVQLFKSLVELLPPLLELFSALLPVLEPILVLLGGIAILIVELINGLTFLATSLLGAKGAGETFGAALDYVRAQTDNAKDGFDRFVEGARTGIQAIVDNITWGKGAAGSGIQEMAAHWDWYNGSVLQKQELAKQYLARYIAGIRGLFSGHNSTVRNAGSAYFGLSNSARAATADAREALRRYVAGINSLLNPSSFYSKAFNSGTSLGSGFADGIRNQINKVLGAASDLAGAAGSFLPGSPAERGPFSGRGWTPYRGAALAAGFAEGIQRLTPLVALAAAQMAEVTSKAMTPGTLDPRADNGLSVALGAAQLAAAGNDGANTPDDGEDAVEALVAALERVQVTVSAQEAASGVNRVNRSNARRG